MKVQQYLLQNQRGVRVKVINFGGTIAGIYIPDKAGRIQNVVLGFEDLEDYTQSDNPYLGCTIGRFANRIAGAKFKLNGATYTLNPNNNGNTLHGGPTGFHRVFWDIDVISHNCLRMTYISRDGEEGFPGNLKAEVVLSLGDDNSVTLEYSATADKPTPVNLTNHTYFNLSGGSNPTILDHELVIHSDQITAVDSLLIPTGELVTIKGTALDFSSRKEIGEDIGNIPVGYDHNYILKKDTGILAPAAVLVDPASGRQLELFTTEPGLQFYSGHYFDGQPLGSGKQQFVKHAGLCLEPQRFPDAPNQPTFPNTILLPGETYHQTSIFKFSIR